MTLQQLKYVIEVASKGTISEAAKSLYVSQPSLTNAIHELEKEMNITIFERTNKGVIVSREGEVFLGYARQVLEQAKLLEERYIGARESKQQFCVSTQHYSFAVNAFVDLIKQYGSDEYDFSLRETKTHEIIEDVANLKSEIGVIYLNEFNEAVIGKMLKVYDLKFTELFVSKPHVFVSKNNPVAKQKTVTFDDLKQYPYLSFEQGEYNSFYYSEEILSTIAHKKNIRVRDRATLFNLLIGLNGYTICSGVIDEQLNGSDIVSVPLNEDGCMRIGFLTNNKVQHSRLGNIYIDALKNYAKNIITRSKSC
jgi:DNA-binding transcriptional LysR family regulator